MVDVVLVNAPWKEGFNRCGRWGGRTISSSRNPPLYFLVAGAVLKRHGFSVAVVDALAEGLGLDAVVERVKGLGPCLVVVESNCASVDADLACVDALKKVVEGKVGLCGLMASVDYKHIMQCFGFVVFVCVAYCW